MDWPLARAKSRLVAPDLFVKPHARRSEHPSSTAAPVSARHAAMKVRLSSACRLHSSAAPRAPGRVGPPSAGSPPRPCSARPVSIDVRSPPQGESIAQAVQSLPVRGEQSRHGTVPVMRELRRPRHLGTPVITSCPTSRVHAYRTPIRSSGCLDRRPSFCSRALCAAHAPELVDDRAPPLADVSWGEAAL